MKRLKRFPLLLCLILAAFPCYGQDREVTVSAEAEILGNNTMGARQQALTSAFRQAVEQGVGALIQSETRVQNAMLISDNIYSKSQGYVKSHDIVEEGRKEGENTYFVKIRATVNMAELGTDLRSLGILQDIMGNPKILSMIEEASTSSGASVLVQESSASIAVEEKLSASNFDLVDREQVNKIRAEEMERMGEFFMDRLIEDPDAIARIAKKAQEYGAQYLLMGTASIQPGPQSGAVFQSNATFKCKVVDASTAEKVALTQKAESGSGRDRASADMYAGQRAGEIAAATIIPQIIQNWSRRANEGVVYLIKLYGVTSYGRQGRKFMQALKGIPGVTECSRRLWDAKLGRLEVDVSFKGGTGDDLLDGIFEVAGGIPGFEDLDLEEQTGNNMNFKVK